MMPRGADEYLLPRALVSSTPRLAVFSGGMVAATGGLMYLAHRTNHHRLERALGWVQVISIGGCDVNNIIWLHQHWSIPTIYDGR
jgi:energy-converting hydrogenase Eha subunit G